MVHILVWKPTGSKAKKIWCFGSKVQSQEKDWDPVQTIRQEEFLFRMGGSACLF